MDILNGLQLTPFEWTMTKACAASPMEFVVRLTGRGSLNCDKFENAVRSALTYQPLLQANLVGGHTHRLSHWRPATNTDPRIIWFTENPSAGYGFPNDFQPIDLSTEIGFRLYSWRYQIENEDRVELKFVFHHACCDGKGAISFIEHVLIYYQALLSGQHPVDKPRVELDVTTKRDARATKSPSFTNRLRKSIVLRPKRAWNMLTKKPATLNFGQQVPSTVYSQPPSQHSLALDVEATKRLSNFANRRQATVNSVLVSKLFTTLNEHLQETCKDRVNQERCIRVLIPFSLRDQRHQHMPAANCVSMAYLEASQGQLKSDDLVDHITRQTQFIRNWQLQYAWIESVDTFARLWPAIKLFKGALKSRATQRPEKAIATSVLSNLGGVFKDADFETDKGRIKISDLTIDSVHLALPCTTVMPVNFSVNFYSGRLSLDVTYLQSIVDSAVATELLDRWRKNIVQAIQL